ncbi:DUF5325 family protein [Texcoconibacillus texcoconensis]|uniref:Uncharacterized protein n=1 Tax=Texcoconibacillus texcoconensis TaxID=1095777 RepID=A0A840QLK1_9BACI|nr:DUF5325 family protein [Texcoconibacillus texcoconensis]MBB5172226.1 hypothetical protein [Texcoconibacillus texcoconensis]
MKSFDGRFFTLACAGIIGLIGTGIGLAEHSVAITIFSIIFSCLAIGTGFRLRKATLAKESDLQ